MFENLTKSTPKKGTILWLIITVLYVMTVIVNEHFELLEAFNFNTKTVSLIKMFGVFGYVFSTLYNFNQTPKNDAPLP